MEYSTFTNAPEEKETTNWITIRSGLTFSSGSGLEQLQLVVRNLRIFFLFKKEVNPPLFKTHLT